MRVTIVCPVSAVKLDITAIGEGTYRIIYLLLPGYSTGLVAVEFR